MNENTMKNDSLVREIGRALLFSCCAVLSLFHSPLSGRRLREEMARIGLGTFPVLAAVAVFVGSSIAMEGYAVFRELGAQGMVGIFVVMACVREMAPVAAGAMVAAKAGAEMASTLGVMRVRQEIDALQVMAVDPCGWLVAPRLLAILIVTPLLVVYADVLMVGAGYAVSVWRLGVNAGAFLEDIRLNVSGTDLLCGLTKGIVFGGVICLLSCFYGFTARGGAEGVGRATNRAVVSVCMVCVLLNYAISAFFYG